MVITFIMSGYESHKFRTSMISEIYTCSPDGPESEPSPNKEHSDQVLKQILSQKSRFNYSYFEAYLTWLITSFFCCFRNMKCFKKRKDRQRLFNEASSRLNEELNLNTLLCTVRMTDFIAQVLHLKTHQKVLINK